MNKLLIAIGVAALLFCGVINASAAIAPDYSTWLTISATTTDTTFNVSLLPAIIADPLELEDPPVPTFIPLEIPAYLQDSYDWEASLTYCYFTAYSAPSPITYTAYEVDKAPIPEPATMLLFGTGLAGLVGYRLRKNKKSPFQR